MLHGCGYYQRLHTDSSTDHIPYIVLSLHQMIYWTHDYGSGRGGDSNNDGDGDGDNYDDSYSNRDMMVLVMTSYLITSGDGGFLI